MTCYKVLVVDSTCCELCCLSVVGGAVPADAYEVTLLNGCDLQDASQFVQVSQQQQQLTVLYNNNALPISECICLLYTSDAADE